MGREWIEIERESADAAYIALSPSLGREWIEIRGTKILDKSLYSLPPWGGSGLKFPRLLLLLGLCVSPSLGREWIEIRGTSFSPRSYLSPSLGREWIEM